MLYISIIGFLVFICCMVALFRERRREREWNSFEDDDYIPHLSFERRR